METYVFFSSAHVQTLLRQNIHDQGVVIVCIVIAAVLGQDFLGLSKQKLRWF